jgi:hypothetical protein
MRIVVWLNENAGDIQAIATIVLVIVTAIYVTLTAKSNKFAREGIEHARRTYEMDLRTRRGANLSIRRSRDGRFSLVARGPSYASRLALELEVEGDSVGLKRVGDFPDLGPDSDPIDLAFPMSEKHLDPRYDGKLARLVGRCENDDGFEDPSGVPNSVWPSHVLLVKSGGLNRLLSRSSSTTRIMGVREM